MKRDDKLKKQNAKFCLSRRQYIISINNSSNKKGGDMTSNIFQDIKDRVDLKDLVRFLRS